MVKMCTSLIESSNFKPLCKTSSSKPLCESIGVSVFAAATADDNKNISVFSVLHFATFHSFGVLFPIKISLLIIKGMVFLVYCPFQYI